MLSNINGVLYFNVDLLAMPQQQVVFQQQVVMMQPDGTQVLMQPMLVNAGGKYFPSLVVK